MTRNGVDALKFERSFHVCKLVDDSDCGNPFARDDIFVINGFYGDLQAKFEAMECIRYFEVEWEPGAFPWRTFRDTVVGASVPQNSISGSIRRGLYERWKEFGLKSRP